MRMDAGISLYMVLSEGELLIPFFSCQIGCLSYPYPEPYLASVTFPLILAKVCQVLLKSCRNMKYCRCKLKLCMGLF